MFVLFAASNMQNAQDHGKAKGVFFFLIRFQMREIYLVIFMNMIDAYQ